MNSAATHHAQPRSTSNVQRPPPTVSPFHRPPATAHRPLSTVSPSHRPSPTVLLLLSLLLAPISHASSANSLGRAGPAGPLWQYGSLEVRPHPLYTGAYEDGLLSSPGTTRNSYIDTFAPGVLVNLGPKWAVDYTPTWTWYSNPAFRDTLGHSVLATGELALLNTTIGARQSYAYSSSPLAETGRQTDTETVTTQAIAQRVLGRQLALVGTFDQRLTFVSSLPDFHEWAVGGFFYSELTSRIKGSLGARVGYAAVYKTADMVYVQPGGDITWTPSDKLTLQGTVALDERVTLASRWRWRESPIFSGSAAYKPFAQTQVRGEIAHQITPSMFNAQTVRTTSYKASGEQRLLGRFWVSGGIAYNHLSYVTTGNSAAVRRKDNVWTYDAALRTTFLRRGSVTVSYRDTDNASNLEGYALRSKRIACAVGYRY